MRLVLLADTHDCNLHTKFEVVPDGDVLIHAGDMAAVGHDAERYKRIGNQLRRMPHKYKLVVPGNHDHLFLENLEEALAALGSGIEVLMDRGVEIEGKKFYGSPWLRWRGGVYSFETQEFAAKWAQIPADTEVLITHELPWGVRDTSGKSGEQIGCKDLRRHVLERVRPQLHVFGHNHMGRGQETIEGVQFVNAAMVDDDYKPMAGATVVDIT
jgi:Icc-related predicted phosphoesterase